MTRHAVIYQDGLVEISTDSILFKEYYFPSLRAKRVPFSAIEKIEIRQPGLFSGKGRLHGTGNLRTWYPLDRQRPTRDRVFVLHIARKWMRIGFTVEDSEAVTRILAAKNLIPAVTPGP